MNKISSIILLEYMFEGKHKNLIIPEGFASDILGKAGKMVGIGGPILSGPEWRDLFTAVGDKSAMGLINNISVKQEPYERAKLFLDFARLISNNTPSKQKYHKAIKDLDTLITQMGAETREIQKRLWGEGVPAQKVAALLKEKIKETKSYRNMSELVNRLAETLPKQVRSDIDRIANTITEDIDINNGRILE